MSIPDVAAAALDGHVDCLYMLKRFGVDLNLRVCGHAVVPVIRAIVLSSGRVS